MQEPIPVTGGGFTSLAPEVFPEDTESTPYLRHDFTCEATPSTCFTPILTAAAGFADVKEDTKFGGHVHFLGASPDLHHVILRSSVQLTETPVGAGIDPLYEYNAGAPSSEALQPVSVLPPNEENGAVVTGFGLGGIENYDTRGAVSADGSRVVWSRDLGGTPALYMRDIATKETVRLDLPQEGNGEGLVNAQFQFASADGSRVFFDDSQHLTAQNEGGLYECRMVESGGHLACDLRNIGGTVDTVAAGSEDGTSLYFASASVLTGVPNARGEHATPGSCNEADRAGTCNLYAWHEDPATGEAHTTFIASVSDEDSTSWGGGSGYVTVHNIAARVSPDGRYFAFMSERPLTGYDNRDAKGGQPDQEVYLYDSHTEKLVCASCNPSGARPQGVQAKLLGQFANEGDELPVGAWFAASLPAWTNSYGPVALSQSRYLSDSGRLFFNSSDALVPQDSNGTQDVYEYEPPKGEGGLASDSCTSESATYSPRSDGCVSLISSGTSPEESVFMDASENGDDVFFLTASRLAPSDVDGAYDIYDAHVCGADGSPCPPPPTPPPPACEGDACQSPVGAPNDPTPGSLTFQGPGNLAPLAATPTKQKAKSKRVKCKRGFVRKHGKCVKRPGKKSKAKKAGNGRKAK